MVGGTSGAGVVWLVRLHAQALCTGQSNRWFVGVEWSQ